MADRAPRWNLELQIALDGSGEIGRREESHGDEERVHQRYPLIWMRNVSVVGASADERRITSARTSRWGMTNQATPPHQPYWAAPPAGELRRSMAGTRCTPRRTSRSACSHPAW